MLEQLNLKSRVRSCRRKYCTNKESYTREESYSTLLPEPDVHPKEDAVASCYTIYPALLPHYADGHVKDTS